MSNESKKRNKFFQAGILGVAIGSALCCLLPLVAVLSGIGALTTLGAFFENLRWPLLIVAGVLLVIYGYKQFYAKGCECSESEMKTRKIGFTIITLCFLGFAILPEIPIVNTPISAQSSQLKLSIKGMTCHGCAVSIKKALEGVPGVTAVSVDLNTKLATISPNSSEIEAAAIKVIESLGYSIDKGVNK